MMISSCHDVALKIFGLKMSWELGFTDGGPRPPPFPSVFRSPVRSNLPKFLKLVYQHGFIGLHASGTPVATATLTVPTVPTPLTTPSMKVGCCSRRSQVKNNLRLVEDGFSVPPWYTSSGEESTVSSYIDEGMYFLGHGVDLWRRAPWTQQG